MGRLTVLLLAYSALAAHPGQAGAQQAFGFQVRAGATVPLGDFRRAEAGWERKGGAGTYLGMGFTFPVIGPLGGYLGFSHERFGCDETVCPPAHSWASTGFDIAARVEAGLGRWSGWLQGGLHTHRIEGRLRTPAGARHLTSRGGWGLEVGAGAFLSVGPRILFGPALRYGRGDVPFSEHPDLRLSYLAADLGVFLSF